MEAGWAGWVSAAGGFPWDLAAAYEQLEPGLGRHDAEGVADTEVFGTARPALAGAG